MSEGTTTTQDALTPREAEALAAFDALPAEDRNYAAVATALGVTEGRAGVYVRDALRKSGRDDTPRRGRKGNGSPNPGAQRSRGITPMTAMMEQYIAQAESTVERLQAQIDEASEALNTFEPAEWIAAEAARLDAEAKAARARATAFAKDDGEVATKAAAAHATALNARQASVIDANEKLIDEAKAAADQARAMLALASESSDEEVPAGAGAQ